MEVRKEGGVGEGGRRAGQRHVHRQPLQKDQQLLALRFHQQDGQEGEEEEQRRWWERQREGMMHLSLMELCFYRHNSRLCAQTYLEVFHQVLGEGLIDRVKSLQVL